MRTIFASALVHIAIAVERQVGNGYYYGSYGSPGSGYVDQNYKPTDIDLGAPYSYNPATGGYIIVPFPETDYDSHSKSDSPSDSYDSFSDFFYSHDDSYNNSGASEDSNISDLYYSNNDMFNNPKNDNVSLSRDSQSDFARNSDSGYSRHGRKHCFDANNLLSDRSDDGNDGASLSLAERIICYFSDSDDGTYHSDDKSSDSSATKHRFSDSDSDDTNTTDDGSLGSTYDYTYDSYGSDYFDIQPDYYDYYPIGYTNYADHNLGLHSKLTFPSHTGRVVLNAGPGYASQNKLYPYNPR